MPASSEILVPVREWDELVAARLTSIPIADIIGRGEIRALAGGVTHRTLQQWRAGLNLKAAGPFPEPIRELESGPLFDRRAVMAWLERH